MQLQPGDCSILRPINHDLLCMANEDLLQFVPIHFSYLCKGHDRRATPGGMPVMKSRSLLVGAVTIGSVVVASTFALLLMRRGLKYTPPPENARIVEETVRVFRDLSYVQADDINALIEVFDTAPVYSVPPDREQPDREQNELDSPTRASLARTISEWISARSSGDAEVYGAWMRSRGYIPAPLTPTDRRLYGKRFQLRTGREITLDDAPLDIFVAAFQHEMSDSREPGPTTAIAVGSSAIEVQTVRIDQASTISDAFTPILMDLVASSNLPEDMTTVRWQDGLERLHWYFYLASSAGASHWMPPVSLNDVINRDGGAMIARVLFMQHTIRKKMIPTIVTLYFDPDSEAWHIDSVEYEFMSIDGITGGPEY